METIFDGILILAGAVAVVSLVVWVVCIALTLNHREDNNAE